MTHTNQKQDVKNIVLSEKKKTIDNLIKDYNKTIYNGGIITSTQATNLKQEVTEYNAAAKYRRIEALSLLIKASDNFDDFYNEYITSPYYQGFSVSLVNEEFILNDKKIYLPFANVDKGINRSIVSDGQYEYMLKVLLYNIVRNAFDGDNSYKGVTTYKIKPLTGNLRQIIKDYNMEKCSINGLKEQIQTIVNAIIPPTMTININRGDVRKIMDGVVRSNVEQKITIANVNTLLRLIFEAMDRVLTKGTYDVVTTDSICESETEQGKENAPKESNE